MLELDVRTIGLFTSVVTAGLALAFWQHRSLPVAGAARAARCWSLAMAVFSVGLLVLGLRTHMPAVVAAIAGNSLAILGYGLVPVGVRALAGRRTVYWPAGVAGGVVAAGLAAGLLVMPDTGLRIVLVAVVAMALTAWLIAELRPWRSSDTARSNRFSAAVAGLLLVVMAIRAAGAVLEPAQPAVMQADGSLPVALALVAFLMFCLAMSFTAMLTEKLGARLDGEIHHRDRLISVIAHDLRTPFNTLIGGTEALSLYASRGMQDRVLETATNVRTAAKQAYDLVENLLFWVRLQITGATTEVVPVDRSCDVAFAPLQAAFREKGVEFVHTRSDGLAVLAEAGGLEVVLRNLYSNALKYSAPGRTVRVRAAQAGAVVEIAVSDEGIGMSPETVAQVLGDGVRASRAGTAGEPGTGLGLALCRDILQNHDGSLAIDSVPGKGTTMRIRLPRAD